MEDLKIIKNNIKREAENNNLEITNNIENIAKAKLRFFGVNEWWRCPCYSHDDMIHGCGKEACLKTIENDGICHCKLFKSKD